MAQKKPFSVLIDESTSLSKNSCLIIYIRSCLGDCDDPLTLFLDIVALTDTTAAGILDALLGRLTKNGITEDFLS